MWKAREKEEVWMALEFLTEDIKEPVWEIDSSVGIIVK